MTELVGFLLAVLVGLSLGLLGGGGSILTVPLLVYVLGFGAKTAVAMSLPIVGAASLVGALGHWPAGNLRLQPALLFGLAAMAGAFAGARLAGFLSGAVQLTILAFRDARGGRLDVPVGSRRRHSAAGRRPDARSAAGDRAGRGCADGASAASAAAA